jgi:hypothetical protein
MKSICRFVYVAALAFSAFSVAPTLASAQSARGSFTLTHEVHWQNAIVPAGEYRYSIEPNGPSSLITLTKMSGNGAGFMLLVNDVETGVLTKQTRLIVVPTAAGSFVSSMELPESGVTLHFAVPTKVREVATTTTLAAATSGK